MTNDEDVFFVDLGLVQLLVEPVEVVVRVGEVQHQPEVQVVAEVGVE